MKTKTRKSGPRKAKKKTPAQIIYVDRYSVTGIPPPSIQTMCKGQCEGMGIVPISRYENRQPWRRLWLKAEKKKKSDDGYHFVECPTCKGTGKEKTKK